MLLTRVLRDVFGRKAQDGPSVLSVIVNFYNNRREARNTLYSLSREYQRAATDLALGGFDERFQSRGGILEDGRD